MVMLVLTRSPLERRKCLYGKKAIDFGTRTEAKDRSRLSGGDLFSTSMTIPGVALLGGPGEVKIGNVFLKKLGSDLVVQSSR